jgi:RNA polymerase sigma-70 factor (ECF subfamily)
MADSTYLERIGQQDSRTGSHLEPGGGSTWSSAVTGRFDQLVQQHRREIYLYISRLTGGRDVTEDLFQETFLRAYKAYAALPDEANTRAWLFKIATNLCRKHFRYLQRHRDVSLHEVLAAVESAASSSHEADYNDPEQILLSQDLARTVHTLIDGLPFKQKAAVIQRKLQGLDYGSIAASLQCSPEAARAHVFQALKKIRQGVEKPPSGSRTTRPTATVCTARATS